MVGWLKQNWPITLILLLATILRFYNFWNLPYTHDELSALLRAQVHSWSEFVETGVKLDNHPAGVQLFVFLQTLVSYEEWWIKLPYLCLGVWSVWFVYIVGRRLRLSESGSLFAAALMATAQYTITYSQWARPYSIGVFLVLLLTWILLRYRADEFKPNRWLIGFAIAASLSGYVHYFTLLQAILVTAFFLPFLPRKKQVQLIVASLVSFFLWLPHLGITLHQLGRGGIGEWLHAPEADQWFKLLEYTFHFSQMVMVLVMVLILVGIMVKRVGLISGELLFLFLSAVSAYLVAYTYSINVNPLLHQGVILFSVPFLFLFIGSFVAEKQKIMLIIPISIVVVMVYSLIYDRDHYRLNYLSEHYSPLKWLNELEHQEESLANLFDLREDFVNLQFEKGIVDRMNLQLVSSLQEDGALEVYLDNLSDSKLFFSTTSVTAPETFAAVLDHYPCIEKTLYYHGGEAYVLSKQCDSRTNIAKQEIFDELINSDNPFSSSHKWRWGELDHSTNTHVVLEYQGLSRDALIVIDIERDGGNLWSGVDLAKFKNPKMRRRKSYQVLLNSEIQNRNDANISTYVWVNGNGGLELLEFYAYSVPANPDKFRLFRQ